MDEAIICDFPEEGEEPNETVGQVGNWNVILRASNDAESGKMAQLVLSYTDFDFLNMVEEVNL